MTTKTSVGKKKTIMPQNTIETLKNLGSSVIKQPVEEMGKMSMDVFDQILGTYYEDEDDFEFQVKKQKQKQASRQEFSVFNFKEHYDKEGLQREIKELTTQIKQEVEMVKKADTSLLSEVKDIEKISLNELPEKAGIYHVRFLEVILSILRTLRLKIGESRTWLQALTSKKAKRGSLFGSRSKKMGTQYSLSQELQSSRSVQ